MWFDGSPITVCKMNLLGSRARARRIVAGDVVRVFNDRHRLIHPGAGLGRPPRGVE